MNLMGLHVQRSSKRKAMHAGPCHGGVAPLIIDRPSRMVECLASRSSGPVLSISYAFHNLYMTVLATLKLGVEVTFTPRLN